MPAISVVVPVYNTDKWLDRCLDSVRSQTFHDLEILCIDDGSVDGTPEILLRHASGDKRIRVVTLPENHGVPYARNLAMEEASGEYLYFMDSDDWIDPDYLEEMFIRAERTGQDVVINGNWYLEYDDPSKRRHCGRFGFVHEEAGFYNPVVVQSSFFPVVWSRLYRLKYLKDNDIHSPLLKGGVEDNYFTSLAEILQEKSYIFNGPFYHYYQREGSLVRQPDAAFHHFQNFRIFLDELHKRGIPPEAAKRFYAQKGLEVKDAERFDFLRSFFIDVEPDVLSCPQLYSAEEAFTMRAFASSPDLESFISCYGSRPGMKFTSTLLRCGVYPSVFEVLDGSWWNWTVG
ncbi:MAG: glycosyltransferase family 2 protein [Bacteroidales bacterium]|nr:glycosyltransferase family 2 protein [Bacteroidales bacterium]